MRPRPKAVLSVALYSAGVCSLLGPLIGVILLGVLGVPENGVQSLAHVVWYPFALLTAGPFGLCAALLATMITSLLSTTSFNAQPPEWWTWTGAFVGGSAGVTFPFALSLFGWGSDDAHSFLVVYGLIGLMAGAVCGGLIGAHSARVFRDLAPDNNQMQRTRPAQASEPRR